MNCSKCGLAKTRRNIVPGRGVLPCRTLLVGEGPGLAEDVLGEAFVGPSGRLLDDMLVEVGIPVEECYFTNAVLCHPTDEVRGPNREPRPDEVLACMPNVLSIVACARPERVVFVGLTAFKYYAKTFSELPSVRLIHPAALLRGGAKTDPRYTIAIRTLGGLCGGYPRGEKLVPPAIARR